MKRPWLALAAIALPHAAAAAADFPPVVVSGPLAEQQAAPSAAPKPATSALSSRFAPAPVPDQTIEPPGGASTGRNGAELSPKLLWAQKKYYQGDGFVPGSTVEGEQQKREKPLPGFNVSVPLQ